MFVVNGMNVIFKMPNIIMITLIHGIHLRNHLVLTKDANKHLVPLHRRQGDLDGACAVY